MALKTGERHLTIVLLFSYTARRPKIRDNTKSTRKTKKRILAIPAAAPAIPPKPRTPATSAIISSKIAQPNICVSPFSRHCRYSQLMIQCDVRQWTTGIFLLLKLSYKKTNLSTMGEIPIWIVGISLFLLGRVPYIPSQSSI